MGLFVPILNQMVFLFAFIVLGFVLSKWNFVPEESPKVLARLESVVFIPALVMGTFIKNCTPEVLATVWKLLLLALALAAVLVPLSIFFAKRCFKEDYLQKIVTYGLAFSNFAYMGNAVIGAVFPDVFFEYTVFCLPFWFLIYLWGAPVLLISGSGGERKQTIAQRLKAFLNPMLVCMFIGMILGLTGLAQKLPSSLTSVVDSLGGCMSPLAMLLTGMTVAKLDFVALFKQWRIYLVAVIKLLVYPLLFIGVFALVPQGGWINQTFLVCGLAMCAMPAGLNTIVVPAAYGKDTSFAAGVALVSHLLSVVTIPLTFMLFQMLVL